MRKERLQEKIQFRFYLHIFISLLGLGLILYTYQCEQNTKAMLHNSSKFICSQENSFDIKIDKKEGWRLSEEGYFMKDSQTISAKYCKGVNND